MSARYFLRPGAASSHDETRQVRVHQHRAVVVPSVQRDGRSPRQQPAALSEQRDVRRPAPPAHTLGTQWLTNHSKWSPTQPDRPHTRSIPAVCRPHDLHIPGTMRGWSPRPYGRWRYHDHQHIPGSLMPVAEPSHARPRCRRRPASPAQPCCSHAAVARRPGVPAIYRAAALRTTCSSCGSSDRNPATDTRPAGSRSPCIRRQPLRASRPVIIITTSRPPDEAVGGHRFPSLLRICQIFGNNHSRKFSRRTVDELPPQWAKMLMRSASSWAAWCPELHIAWGCPASSCRKQSGPSRSTQRRSRASMLSPPPPDQLPCASTSGMVRSSASI